MIVIPLTRGRSGSEGSMSVDDVASREALCSEGIEFSVEVANGCNVPAFFVFVITEVDMVDRWSWVATLQMSRRESAGFRGCLRRVLVC